MTSVPFSFDGTADITITYADLGGNAPLASASFNTSTSTWPPRPACDRCLWVGGDETNAPPVTDGDLWIRPAT